MSVATAEADGTPHISVLLYLTDQDLNFYFLTHAKTKKVADLQNNPLVAGEVHTVPDWYIQFHGAATKLTGTDADKAMENFAKRAAEFKNFWSPFFMNTSTDQLVYKITPNWLRLMDLSQKNITIDPAPIYTIIGN